MIIKIKKNFGNTQVELEVLAEKEKDALARALFYAESDVCLYKNNEKICGSRLIVWQANKAKTDDGIYTYIKRRCLACGATSMAGEYKEGGYYWKKWEKYDGGDKSSEAKKEYEQSSKEFDNWE